MPQMGYDMREGTVVRWLRQEGDEVKRGENIAEIETDKAVVEMEALGSGILRKILVAEGNTVPVGTVIGLIAGADEPLPEVMAEKPAPVATEAPTAAPATPPVAAPPERAQPEPARAAAPASPVARRLAQEKGIDLSLLQGTGPGGRITKEDVLAFEVPPVAAAPAQAPAAEQVAETVPLTRMRQAIARLTSHAKREIPHFYVAADVDMTQAMSIRQGLNQTLEEQGVRVTVNDFIIKACTIALQKHPAFNSFFQEDSLKVNSAINIGIAIAMEEGLMVPAILDCGSKSLAEIAQASRDLAERAQRGVLRPDEYTAATFSISNLGSFDVDSFVAIIHPPQSAVLATGTVKKQPVVRDDQVVVAQMMTATLSVDHRVADGAQGAQFLREIKQLLENPVGLLL